MRTYELTFVVRPDLSEDKVTNAVEQVQQWVKAEGNDVTRVDKWGRRRLAYPLNDHREGHYFLFEVSIEPQTLGEIERNLKLSDNILRYLLIRADE